MFNDTSKTAKITWFLLVLHWAMDVIYDFYYIHSPMEYRRNQVIFALLDVSLNNLGALFYSPLDFSDASDLHQTVVKFIG